MLSDQSKGILRVMQCVPPRPRRRLADVEMFADVKEMREEEKKKKQ